LVFPLYDMTWPMEEMPYNNVASCCLAVPWYYISGEGLGKLPWASGNNDIYSILRSGLTWDKKDRLLPTAATADNNIYYMPCSG
jgi:hypothetical protein